MRVFVAQVVVDVRASDVFAHGSKTGSDTLFLGAIGQVRMPDIKIEAQSGEPGLLDKSTQIGRLAHLAGSVFHADGYADVFGMKHQVLQGTERGVSFARVGCVAVTAQVKNHPRERKVLCDIDGPFQLVHGFDAPDAFDFRDGKGSTAFTVGTKVTAGWSVQ